jgi:hypothetical protein
MRKLLLTKFKHWEYEQEYRVYIELEEQVDGFFFSDFSDQLKLEQVIVGDRSNITRDQVSGVLGELESDVEAFKARAGFTKFEVVKQLDHNKWA